MPIIPKDFKLPFVKKEQVAKDAWTFYFDRSAEQNLDFLPGQYIKIILDIQEQDKRGISRSFSISSSPLNKQYLTITTRIIQSAFKKRLAVLTEGEMVQFFGPVGLFVLKEEEIQSCIFLAGGIGITPFHSMISYAAERKLSLPITLLVSFSTTEDFVFYDELIRISADHPNIKIVYTISKTEESQKSWNGQTGRISADVIKKYCPDFMNSLLYIAGPSEMVDALLEIVKGMGVPDEQVKKEKFVGY